VRATLTPRYGWLVLNGPLLGLSAQTLDGQVVGGRFPYAVTFYVEDPNGVQRTYSLSIRATFSFGPLQAGDTYFGVSEEGTWQAWFTVTDSLGSTGASNIATWEVTFYPVHENP